MSCQFCGEDSCDCADRGEDWLSGHCEACGKYLVYCDCDEPKPVPARLDEGMPEPTCAMCGQRASRCECHARGDRDD